MAKDWELKQGRETGQKKKFTNVIYQLNSPANFHPYWMFSDLCFEFLYVLSRSQEVWFSLLLMEEGLTNPSWILIIAYTGTGKETRSIFFLLGPPFRDWDQKPGLCHLPALQCHYLLANAFYSLSFPFQNMNLPTHSILRFCCVFNHLVLKTIINTLQNNGESPSFSEIYRLTIKNKEQL